MVRAVRPEPSAARQRFALQAAGGGQPEPPCPGPLHRNLRPLASPQAPLGERARSPVGRRFDAFVVHLPACISQQRSYAPMAMSTVPARQLDHVGNPTFLVSTPRWKPTSRGSAPPLNATCTALGNLRPAARMIDAAPLPAMQASPVGQWATRRARKLLGDRFAIARQATAFPLRPGTGSICPVSDPKPLAEAAHSLCAAASVPSGVPRPFRRASSSGDGRFARRRRSVRSHRRGVSPAPSELQHDATQRQPLQARASCPSSMAPASRS